MSGVISQSAARGGPSAGSPASRTSAAAAPAGGSPAALTLSTGARRDTVILRTQRKKFFEILCPHCTAEEAERLPEPTFLIRMQRGPVRIGHHLASTASGGPL